MKERLPHLLPLLHKLVEERAGERRFPILADWPFMSQLWRFWPP